MRSTRQSPKKDRPSVRHRGRAIAAILMSAGVHAALLLCLRSRSAPVVRPIEADTEVVVDIRYEDREAQVVEKASSPSDVGARRTWAAHRGPRTFASPAPALTPPLPGADEQLAPFAAEQPGALAMRSRGGEEPEDVSISSDASSSEKNIASATARVASAMVDREDQRGDKDSSQARVDRWKHDAIGEANARAGDVPPVWHDIEIRVQESFHPPRSVVTKSSTATVLGRQLLNTGAARASTDALARAAEPASREASLMADVMAGQAAAASPAAWIRTEIVVEVGPDGLLRRTEITTSSGRTAFDKLALDAVCAAIAERPILNGCRRAPPCTTRLRWAVEAALRVEPPPVIVPSDPHTGAASRGITPLALRFSFDETTGKVQHHRAFESEIRTRVKLLSID